MVLVVFVVLFCERVVLLVVLVALLCVLGALFRGLVVFVVPVALLCVLALVSPSQYGNGRTTLPTRMSRSFFFHLDTSLAGRIGPSHSQCFGIFWTKDNDPAYALAVFARMYTLAFDCWSMRWNAGSKRRQ